tara:strand:- start:421 stop:786 length:366 start_codon:yes stop_codon:yes gene_type:complete
MYTALVLDDESHEKLLIKVKSPEGWTTFAHHMTINMGGCDKGPAVGRLDETATLKVVAFAQDERVMAVRVETDIPSKNEIKHITIAVNVEAGGKPFHSNKLTNWTDLQLPFNLTGVIQECN